MHIKTLPNILYWCKYFKKYNDAGMIYNDIQNKGLLSLIWKYANNKNSKETIILEILLTLDWLKILSLIIYFR